MKQVIENDTVVEGMQLGKYRVVNVYDKEATVECECGTINTYRISYLRNTTGPRQCFECVKKNREEFSMNSNKTIPKGSKFPTSTPEDMERMIKEFENAK